MRVTNATWQHAIGIRAVAPQRLELILGKQPTIRAIAHSVAAGLDALGLAGAVSGALAKWQRSQ